MGKKTDGGLEIAKSFSAAGKRKNGFGSTMIEVVIPKGKRVKRLHSKILIAAVIWLLGAANAYAAGYWPPVKGVIPHYGLSTTSNNCKICHGLHGTDPGAFHLLRHKVTSITWRGCEQCHWEGASFAAPSVYNLPGVIRGQHRIGATRMTASSSAVTWRGGRMP